MFYILVIAGFSGILMLADAFIGYKREVAGKEPEGISGFRRSIIALTVILIIGIAMFHLLVEKNLSNDISDELVRNVLSMFTALVAAIIGFYFGGKPAEKRASEAEVRTAAAEKRAENAETKVVAATEERAKEAEAKLKNMKTNGD